MTPQTCYYFAYGSNMNKARMLARGVPFANAQPATLPGYRLTFDKLAGDGQHGYATIEPHPGSHVEGVLYTVPIWGIQRLDRHEGVPWHYDKAVFRLEHGDGIVYLAHPDKTVPGLSPSASYLAHLLQGRPYLSKAYYEFLCSFQEAV